MSIIGWSWIYISIFMVILFYLAWKGMQKTKTATDFATASRSYGPLIIGLALMATTCSAAATMGNPGLVYAYGWPGLWYGMGGYMGVLVAWATSAIMLSRIGKNAGAKSMPDFMALRFNSPLLRVVTAVACISIIYYIAGQFAGLGWVFANALGFPYIVGVVVGGFVIAAYISFGGTHADILNCAIQAVLMMIVAVLVCVPIFIHIGGIGAIDKILTAKDSLMSSSVIFRGPLFGPFSGPAIFVSLGLFALTPQLSKLWLALDDERHVPKALLWAFLAIIFMTMIMWFGGLGGKILFPGIKPDTATVAILKAYWPPYISAFGMVGILAAVMSTSAGLFLVVAVALAVDIYQDTIVVYSKKRVPKEIMDKRVLLMQRILIPLVTVVGMLIAMDPPKFLTQLMWTGIGVFVGGVIPVMIVGCLWKKTTKAAAEIASITGFVIYLIMIFGLGQGMGIGFFKVPWSCCGVSAIVVFVLVIGLSFVTKPMDEEYVDALFVKS